MFGQTNPIEYKQGEEKNTKLPKVDSFKTIETMNLLSYVGTQLKASFQNGPF